MSEILQLNNEFRNVFQLASCLSHVPDCILSHLSACTVLILFVSSHYLSYLSAHFISVKDIIKYIRHIQETYDSFRLEEGHLGLTPVATIPTAGYSSGMAKNREKQRFKKVIEHPKVFGNSVSKNIVEFVSIESTLKYW
jgi:hypothetical protein